MSEVRLVVREAGRDWSGTIHAEMSGPSFWHLDGSSMDDDFAFDMYHRTREEWEEELPS
jgi:hypothetical protein